MTYEKGFKILLLLSLLSFVHGRASPVAYNIILVIVIVELLFAFSVGIFCVVFSFNLIMTLKESSSDVMNTLPIGDLPARNSLQQRPSFDAGRNNFQDLESSARANSFSRNNTDIRGSATGDYKTFQDGQSSLNYRNSLASADYGINRENNNNNNQNKFSEVFNTFYSYIRLW
jgi:hypothetical protein